jgi:hypothetical protein
MVVGGAPVGDAQPVQSLDITRDVNCVLLSVVNFKLIPRGLEGKAYETARFSAARASSVRQRRRKSQLTISRVQQSISETRYGW